MNVCVCVCTCVCVCVCVCVCTDVCTDLYSSNRCQPTSVVSSQFQCNQYILADTSHTKRQNSQLHRSQVRMACAVHSETNSAQQYSGIQTLSLGELCFTSSVAVIIATVMILSRGQTGVPGTRVPAR